MPMSCLTGAMLCVSATLGVLVLLMLLSTYTSHDRRRRRTMQITTCGMVESARGYLATAEDEANASDPTARLLLSSRAHALLREATRSLGEHGMPQTLCSSSGTESATALLDASRKMMAESSKLLTR